MATRLLKPLLNAARNASFRCRSVHELATARPVITSSKVALAHQPPCELTQLDNGVRVVCEERDMKSATVGLWFDAGSRYESEDLNGAARFVEQMLLRGSSGKGARELQQSVADIGGYLHSDTGREQSCLYINCLAQHVPRALEILTDLILNPTLDPQAIEEVRAELVRDMEHVEREPRDVTMDYAHASAYQGTGLAHSPLGTLDVIKSLTKDQLIYYLDNNLRISSRVVLAGVGGGVAHDTLLSLADRLQLGRLSHHYPSGEIPSALPCRYTGSELRYTDDTMPLSHAVLCVESPGWDNPDNIPLMVGCQLVGGWDAAMGEGEFNPCRLATYNHYNSVSAGYDSFMVTYKDTGLWGIYFTTYRPTGNDFMQELTHDWKRLGRTVSNEEVNRAKNQLKLKVFSKLDGTTAVCEDIASQVLWYGRRVPMSEIVSRINAVDAEVLHDVIDRYVLKAEPVLASTGCNESLMDLCITRSYLKTSIF